MLSIVSCETCLALVMLTSIVNINRKPDVITDLNIGVAVVVDWTTSEHCRSITSRLTAAAAARISASHRASASRNQLIVRVSGG